VVCEKVLKFGAAVVELATFVGIMMVYMVRPMRPVRGMTASGLLPATLHFRRARGPTANGELPTRRLFAARRAGAADEASTISEMLAARRRTRELQRQCVCSLHDAPVPSVSLSEGLGGNVSRETKQRPSLR